MTVLSHSTARKVRGATSTTERPPVSPRPVEEPIGAILDTATAGKEGEESAGEWAHAPRGPGERDRPGHAGAPPGVGSPGRGSAPPEYAACVNTHEKE